MKREFIINIILLIAINLIIKPVYIFGIEARVQNLVGTESYGLYFDYFNFVFLFQFINDPGIQSWNAQFVPKVRSQIGFHFPKIMKIKLWLSFIYIGVVWLSSSLMGYERYDLILLLSINMILSTMFMFLRGTIAGLGYYRHDSLFSALDKAVMIVILGYLAWFSPYQSSFRIEALVYGQMAAFSIAVLLALFFLWEKIPKKKWTLTTAYVKDKFHEFLPYTLVIFLVAGYSRLDGVMLGRMLDDNNYQAGLYATAFRFYDAANMIGYLFAALLLPMYAASLKNYIQLNELISTGLRYIVVCATIIVCSLSFYSMEFMYLLYDEATDEFGRVLIVLIISFFTVAVAYIFGTLLVAGDKVSKLNYLYAGGLVLNFTLNYLLIPEHKAFGAAWTTLITQMLIMTGQVIYAIYSFKLKPGWKLFTALIGYVILVAIVFYIIRAAFSYHWFYQLSASILISLLLAFIFRIINLAEAFNLLRVKNAGV